MTPDPPLATDVIGLPPSEAQRALQAALVGAALGVVLALAARAARGG
jgi:hypothetical protein